jgi:hypothetical protein
MLQTFEASLEPNGQLRFVDPAAPKSAVSREVLVTFLPTTDLSSALTDETAEKQESDWRAFVGALKDSPSFAVDALAMQHQMRGEWH